MKILHTADLHLSDGKKNTIEALELILDKAKELKIDKLTISGDFFDSNQDANILRTKLRSLLSNLDFEILIASGNHDIDCFLDNLDFGSSVNLLTDKPFTLLELDENTQLCGLFYIDKPNAEILSELKKTVQPEKTNILLLHCTLDVGYTSSDIGEEGDDKYFLISSAVLADLGFDYILAGHFHTNSIIKNLDKKTVFSYPGSPTSITSKEIGKRSIVYLDTTIKEIKCIPLDSFYYDEIVLMIHPSILEKRLEELENWLKRHEGDNCNLRVLIKGFGNITETDFRSKLEAMIPENTYLVNEYKDISNVLNHTLFKRFQEILEKGEFEERENMHNFAIEIFSNLLARRDID